MATNPQNLQDLIDRTEKQMQDIINYNNKYLGPNVIEKNDFLLNPVKNDGQKESRIHVRENPHRFQGDYAYLKSIKEQLNAIKTLPPEEQAKLASKIAEFDTIVNNNIANLTTLKGKVDEWVKNEAAWKKAWKKMTSKEKLSNKRNFYFPVHESDLSSKLSKKSSWQLQKEAQDVKDEAETLGDKIRQAEKDLREYGVAFTRMNPSEIDSYEKSAGKLKTTSGTGEFLMDENFIRYEKGTQELRNRLAEYETLKRAAEHQHINDNEALMKPFNAQIQEIEKTISANEKLMTPETLKGLEAEIACLKHYQEHGYRDRSSYTHGSIESEPNFKRHVDLIGKLQHFSDDVNKKVANKELASDQLLEYSSGYDLDALRFEAPKALPQAKPITTITQSELEARNAQIKANEAEISQGMKSIEDRMAEISKLKSKLQDARLREHDKRYPENHEKIRETIRSNLDILDKEREFLEQLKEHNSQMPRTLETTTDIANKLKLYGPGVDAIKNDTKAMEENLDKWLEEERAEYPNTQKVLGSRKAYKAITDQFPHQTTTRAYAGVPDQQQRNNKKDQVIKKAEVLDEQIKALQKELGIQNSRRIPLVIAARNLEFNQIGEFNKDNYLERYTQQVSKDQELLANLQQQVQELRATNAAAAKATPAAPTVTASSTATAASTPTSNAVPTNVVPLKPTPPTPIATVTPDAPDATAGTDTTAAPVPQPPTAPALHLVPKQEAAPKVAPTPPTTTPGDAAAVATTDTAKPTSVVGGDATAGTTATATGIGTGTATQTAADVTPKPADASATVTTSISAQPNIPATPSISVTSNSPAASSTPATSNVPATPSTPADATITPTPGVTNAAIAAATITDADLKAKEDAAKAAALAASVAAQKAQEAQEEAARAAADQAKPTSFEVAPAANTTLEIEKAKKPGTTPHATMGTGGEDLSFKAQGGAKPDEAADAKAKKKIETKKKIPLKWEPVPITWEQFFKELGRLFLQIGETYKIFKEWVHKKLDAKKLKEQQEALAKQQNAAKQLANNAKASAISSNPTLAANPNFQALTNELDEAAAEADNQAKDALDAVNAQLSLIANTPNTPAATTQPAAASTVTNPSAVATTPTPPEEPKNKEEKVTAEAVATSKGEKTASADVAGMNANSAAAAESNIPAAPPITTTTPDAPEVPKSSEIPEKKPGVVADKDAPKPLTTQEKRELQVAKRAILHTNDELARTKAAKGDQEKQLRILAKKLDANDPALKDMQDKIAKLENDIKFHEDNIKGYQSKVNNLEARNTAPDTEVLKDVLLRVIKPPSSEEIVPSKNHVSVSQGNVASIVASLQRAREEARGQNIHGSEELAQNKEKPATGEVVEMNFGQKIHKNHADDRLRAETQAQRAQAEQAEQDRKIVEQAKAQAQAEQTGTEGTTPDASRPKAASGPRV